MANEIEVVSLVDAWLYGVLSGDATLNAAVGGRIVGDTGDLGSFAVPFVSFAFQSGRDITTVSGVVLDTSNLYVVKVVGLSGSWSTLNPIAARAHSLIHAVAHTFPGGGSLTCVREQVVRYVEEEAGRQYRHLGGQYRIRASRE